MGISSLPLWVVMILVLVEGWCCFGCLEQERIALLQLKANINDPNGNSLPSWVDEDTADCCQWEGVECSNTTTNRVTQLSLNHTRRFALGDGYINKLGDWYFNASLFLPFEEIRALHLFDNLLVGWIENEGFENLLRLGNLEVLDLRANHFNNSVLSSLSALSSLKYLDLSNNRLRGSTDSSCFGRLTGLSNLEVLDLSGNGLNSSIHSFLKLDDLVSLKELSLDYNQIQSFEPVQGLEGSSVLSNLEVLKLSANNLNNSILPSLRGLSTLKFLDLSYNRLKGSIHVKDLNALCNLKELDVSVNEIESFVNPEGSRNVSNLENLFLDRSSLGKNFLQSIGVLTSLKVLSLSSCDLDGTLPSVGWCELRNLQELDLSSNRLQGMLPPCLENLTSLRVLDLFDNQLTGSIASSPLSTLTSLEYLSLSTNHFQVPASFRSFANHSRLKVLLCVDNIMIAENELNTWAPRFQLKVFAFSNQTKDNFIVALPSFLYYQYDLRIVDLSHNKLSGTFPNWILENNTRLEGLSLRDSSLVGPLNLLSHSCPNLLHMDISDNKIEGRIPQNMSSIFPNLLVLNMSRNAFDGNLIPYDMNALRYLDLSNNLLSGMMPEYFTKRSLSLEVIILSNNYLSGQISPKVFNLTKLTHLYLNGNKFIGNVPDSLSLIPLSILDVSQNHFSGELPTWMGNMTNLVDILMSKNHFQGPIPVEFCQLRMRLMFLDLSENDLSGSIPSCFNLLGIVHIHLYKNRLEGPMPRAFYNNSYLETLDLRNNYLSGSIPTWISGLSGLSVLLLKANNFEGRIPSHLCQLKKLTILDLSQNNLSGSLPHCLGNTIPFEANEMLPRPHVYYHEELYPQESLLSYVNSTMLHQIGNSFMSEIGMYILEGTKAEVEFTTKRISYTYKGKVLSFMSGIDFSSNQLTGEIPLEFGNLSNIRALNLSHNNFTGSIPTTFSNLRQVESLDLSYNNLNGRIPSQLIELNSLAVFSVAHNNLSGMTPDRKAQFATFQESSYEGNPLLCGLPLHDSCNEIAPPLPNASNHQAEEDGFVDMRVFYVSFYASYVIVLFGIAAVLYINPHWRQAWFYLIEVCITSSYYFVVDNFPKLPKFRNM